LIAGAEGFFERSIPVIFS
jgi:hypothetical protein